MSGHIKGTYHHSEETKRKIGLANKGNIPWTKGKHRSEETKKKISEANKGEISWIKGKHQSEDYRRKISDSHKKNKNWNWKGGITSLIRQIRKCFEYRQWRSDIFTRDDFTCVLCNKRGGRIEVDHYPKSFSKIFHENNIKSLEQAIECEEFWNINNGRTLCKKCHWDKTKSSFEFVPKEEV